MINLIAACGHDRVIGNKGKLPWTIEEDWKYFLDTTKDGILVMGRRCYDEFERFASNREVIALSRNPDQTFARAKKSNSLSDAIESCREAGKRHGFAAAARFTRKQCLWRTGSTSRSSTPPFEGAMSFSLLGKKLFATSYPSKKIQTEEYDLTFRILGK